MQKELLMKYGQAVSFLPPRLRDSATRLTEEEKEGASEFRLRAGNLMTICINGKEKEIDDCPVCHEELSCVLELATRGSVHTAETSIRKGYITLLGGHRLGLCGTAARNSSGILTIRDLSSVCIRIAKPIYTAAEKALPLVCVNGKFKNTIIISPPGHGKTTMLRDLVRRLSNSGFKISLIDERGEIAAKKRGIPQFDVGRSTDVMDGVEKAEGASLMLRTMSPDIVALDEITAEEDVGAIFGIVNCGAGILATVHGESVDGIFDKPIFSSLKEMNVFEKALILKRRDEVFTFDVAEIRRRA